jgi:RNA-directed DNA polymerase
MYQQIHKTPLQGRQQLIRAAVFIGEAMSWFTKLQGILGSLLGTLKSKVQEEEKARRYTPSSDSKEKDYPSPKWGKQELLRRLNLSELKITYFVRGVNPANTNQLDPGLVPVGYWWHRVPKQTGGTRLLYSPNPRLKLIQKMLLKQVFARLKVHSAVKGFRTGESTLTHAKLHTGQAVVVRIDVKSFFTNTRLNRVYSYFRMLGWDRETARLMLQLCCHKNGLPQGAPTSPILSNLVNYRMDARLAGLAIRSKATYSRYADDLIFSFSEDNRRFIRGVVRRVARILFDFGYRMNKSKLRVMRQHNRQVVTGLVVNEKVQLPRKTRRWLRAVEHHIKTGKAATLTVEQLKGWKAYQQMIGQQNK